MQKYSSLLDITSPTNLIQNVADSVCVLFRCIGTSQHLKSKYGGGYQLEIKLADSEHGDEDMEKLKRFIQQSFPTSYEIECFSDRVMYGLPQNSSNAPGDVFGALEKSRCWLFQV